MTTQHRVNPDCLKLGRQARGLNQTQLAEAAKMTQGAISKFENSLSEPGEDAIAKIAEALRLPVSFFYQQDRIYGLPVSVSMSYRKKASVGVRAIEQLEAEVNVRIMHLRRLLSSVDFEPELQFPQFDIDEFGGSAAKVAEVVRGLWQIPSGPIRNLVDVVERAGCIVFACDFQSLGVDGLTLQPRGLPPCVFLNSSMPGDRQRFTLAHELGHAIMHQVPNSNMEQEADEFASALLMPARDISPEFAGGVTLQRLAALKPVWRASMASLLMCAKRVGAVSESQSSYLWRQFSKAGYRTKEPVELAIPTEQPRVLNDILQAHVSDLGYSVAELSRMLHVFEVDLLDMHRLEQPKKAGLRLVK